MTYDRGPIFIVDDDDGHCELIRRNLKRCGLQNSLQVYHDAHSALTALRANEQESPALILLDIKMPGRLDGCELLRQIKSDEALRAIPVLMLTTTDNPREIRRCYEYGCNAYVTKPVDFHQFNRVIRRIGLFLSVVQLSSGHD